MTLATNYNKQAFNSGRLTRRHIKHAAGEVDTTEVGWEMFSLACARWQDGHELLADGMCGPITRKAIEAEWDDLRVQKCLPVEPFMGVDATVSDGFGSERRKGPHQGADFMLRYDEDWELPPGCKVYKKTWVFPTWIRAAAAGEVTSITAKGNGGWLWIHHADDTWTQYGHLDSYLIEVEKKQVVEMGQRLGPAAPIKQMWPPHLHFGHRQRGDGEARRYRDPIPWLES